MKIEKMKLKISTGFTLIELLIVIALLGALAVGLLAAVDPFEQLKKGTDTSRRNTVAELFNASIRYYANHSAFPWTSATPPQGESVNNLGYVIGALETAGELKADFSNLAGGSSALAKMYVTSVTTAGSESVFVCFQPESKAFSTDKNTIYDASGVTTVVTNTCKSYPGGTVACYWCMK